MNRKSLIQAIFSLWLIGVMVGCTTNQANLVAESKITREEAERTALAKVPGGKIKEGELEKEHGRLVWSFDIATPGSKDISEIHVDAVSGEVIAFEKETPADEEKEKREKKQ